MCRISDFHVNEIDFNGKVCKLTELSLPISEERKLLELKEEKKEFGYEKTEKTNENIIYPNLY